MPRDVHNPETLFNSLQYGFSQIAVATGSRIVTISGQVGWDAAQNLIGSGDLRAQTFQAFHNLELAAKTINSGLDDIVSLRIYIVASEMDDSTPVSEALKQFFPENPPTSTWIGVPRLADKNFLIEIEALAIL